MTYARDPVSELFDAGARKLLARAYRAKGRWVSTRITGPEPRHVAYLLRIGVNPWGGDPVRGGRARTRWARGFVRAMYYQHQLYSGAKGWRGRRMVRRKDLALQVEVGRQLLEHGVFPAGRAVRARVMTGGATARRAVARKPAAQQLFDSYGTPVASPMVTSGVDWANNV